MFEGIPIVGLTPAALLGITVLLLLTGRLVPRIALKDKTEEAERWRLAYEAEREARATSDTHTTELLEGVKTSHAIITALFEAAQLVDTIQEINKKSRAGGENAPLPKT